MHAGYPRPNYGNYRMQGKVTGQLLSVKVLYGLQEVCILLPMEWECRKLCIRVRQWNRNQYCDFI